MYFSCIKYDKIFKEYLKECMYQLKGSRKNTTIKVTNLDNWVYFFTSHIIVKLPESIVPFKIEVQEYKNLTANMEQQFYDDTRLSDAFPSYIDDKPVYKFINKDNESIYIDMKLLDDWIDMTEVSFNGTDSKSPVYMIYDDECIGFVLPIIKR